MNQSPQARIGAWIAIAAVCCIASAISCGDKSKGPTCNSDKDCKAPLVCGDNKCVECNNDGQCGAGKQCSAHACVAAPQCEHDDQCPAGQVCQAGSCKPCASDGECGPGGTCNAGACTKAKKCTKDDQCADDEDCKDGYCRKANQPVTNEGCQLSTVYFAFDSSGIEASERDRLDGDSACIQKTKGKNVFVVGHTDTSGTEEYNIALSERRAQAAADYLARLGTDPARMQIVPKGETEPTGLGDDKDRRVEFQWH
ncbi:MAG TPA: OmpA family protein [Kofleriaceae bacterium]|jgi:Cys-rich repeat protein